MVRRQFSPQVGLIENSENLYFARANNQALKAALGRYVLILNSDTELQEGALARMVGFMDSNPGVGACGPMVVRPDQTIVTHTQWRFRSVAGIALSNETGSRMFRNSAIVARQRMADWDRLSLRQVDVLSDACLVVRRSALEEIGYYDDQFRLYFTEDDLCRRLWDAAWKVVYYPDARVIHLGGRSSRQRGRFHIYRICYGDMVHYFSKHGSWTERAAIRVVGLSDLAVAALLDWLRPWVAPHEQ